MRKYLAVGILLGALGATSAFGAEWQVAWKSDTETVSLDKQGMKRIDGSKVRVSIMDKYSQTQAAKGESFRIPEHDMSIGEYVVDCRDFTSTINRNTWYLGSKVVREFAGPSKTLPAPPQFERGIPAALRLACSLAGNS